jgi:hypothetical protein
VKAALETRLAAYAGRPPYLFFLQAFGRELHWCLAMHALTSLVVSRQHALQSAAVQQLPGETFVQPFGT